MTEEEAKKKTCHKTLAPVAGDPGTAPWHSPRPCIGSACMAWRWTEREFYRPVELWSKSKGCIVVSAYSDDAEWRPVAGASPDDPPPASGLCGVVGKP